MATWIIGGALVLIIAAVIAVMIRDQKAGKGSCSCSGNCSHCSKCNH